MVDGVAPPPPAPAAPALPTTFYAAVHERLPQAIAFFYVEVVIKHDEKACKQVMWEIANSAHGKLDAIIDACQRVQDALATLTVTTRQTRAEVAAGRAENREGRAAADGTRPVLGARFIVRLPQLAADWAPPSRP